jgi:hypothetical protein
MTTTIEAITSKNKSYTKAENLLEPLSPRRFSYLAETV